MKTYFTYKSAYVEDFKTEFKVFKKVQLAKKEFNDIASNLLKDFDLIKENKNEMKVKKNKIFHCLFIYCEELEDGLLICSQGYDYARYASSYPKKSLI